MSRDLEPGPQQQWPADGLEHLLSCPVCGRVERSLFHEKLTDWLLGVPGEWTMWRCAGCGSGYLDPRPTPETIGLAYANYHTHAEFELPSPKGGLEYLRRAAGNDYRRSHYGARHLHPRLPYLGTLIAAFAPSMKRRVDYSYRMLPRRTPLRRLFDFGCGNGAYLQLAANAGWETAGVEPDSQARQLAIEFGDVRPQLADWADHSSCFDYVTASHVIEHVHDPRETIGKLVRLLAPGGVLFIDTPNMEAPTHDRFGSAWRGLEPPRHLFLLSRRALYDLLTTAGLEIVRWVEAPDAADYLVEQSSRLFGLTDACSGTLSAAGHRTRDGEFLTVIARKAW